MLIGRVFLLVYGLFSVRMICCVFGFVLINFVFLIVILL